MSSTWIQMPIENAKEVVQRYINTKTTLVGVYGKTVTYESDCEVYFDKNDFDNFSFNPIYFYFGYLYFPNDTGAVESSLQLDLKDTNGGNIPVLYASTNTFSQSFLPIAFNEVKSTPNTYITFLGYKFKLV